MLILCLLHFLEAQVQLESEVLIANNALHFDGVKVASGTPNNGTPYDYKFGPNISAHGDCVKEFNGFVFTTWYRGDKNDRHMMLSRYNKSTGIVKTVEFPHRHTGFLNQWWIGESHNTIAVGISPLDGTIHLLFDMHAYSRTKPSDGSFSDDYFRYSYSVPGAATVSDADFTINQFVQSPSGDYKHLSLNGTEDHAAFSGLTYPQFFLNDSGDLFMYMRKGGNDNGAYKFTKYSASTGSWSDFTQFNVLNAKSYGETYNWGLYGNMKYVNGKIRIGFQRRSSNKNDKYLYQNGFYYGYSDDQNGFTGWKNHSGAGFNLPLVDADFIKVSEPGDLVATTATDMVRIVDGFDWTVTGQGDVHLIGKVKDLENNVTTYMHTYKPAGASNFTTTTNFSGASAIYTAGSNIYIIGLNAAGRVFVEEAAGGTNNFTRVYEATSGKQFHHGRVHISQDKVYYYLMEQASGSARPVYLQIIDLGLSQFTASVTAPANNSTFALGDTIALSANASSNIGISKVNFRVNSAFHQQDVTAPYEATWVPTQTGTYTIDVAAYDSNDSSIYSSPVTVNIIQAQGPTVSFSQPTGDLTVDEGYSLTAVVDATDADGSVSNVKLYIDGTLVRQESFAPFEWGHAGSPNPNELNGLTAGVYEFKAIATDNEGLTGEATFTLTVNALNVTIESVDAEQSPNFATNMLDGNTADDSRWSAKFFPKSVVFDLGASRQITGTNMWTYQDRAYQYRVEVSDAPSSGFSIVSDQTSNTSSAQPLATSFSATGRYLKLTVTGAHNYSGDWASITEFEIVTGSGARMAGSSLSEALEFKIYPNPASDQFTIDLRGLGKSSVYIYDINGALVLQESAAEALLQLSKGESFKAGIYLVNVVDQFNQHHKQKLIIK